MKKKPLNKNLINEVNDMRHMMRNLEENKHIPVQQLNEQPIQLLNEQAGPHPCALNNGGCHQDCTCIEVACSNTTSCTPYQQQNNFAIADCCCGNAIPTISGCQPGPCQSAADCGQSWEHCCYADSGMAAAGFPSCNHPDDCYSYPAGTTSTSSTEAGCTDSYALNYCSTCAIDNQECCYPNNSGCMSPMYPNYSQGHDCDCNHNWVQVGVGNTNCCESDDPSSGNSGSSSGSSGSSSSGGNSACFIDGSMVMMDNGEEKNISKVEIGEVVKSEIGESTVIGIDIHKGTFEIYSFNGGKSFTTAEHPFKTTEGWKAIDPIKTITQHGVDATTLKEGDTLITLEGEKELKEITLDEKTHNIVYNLILNNEHVYYTNRYLVHNGKNITDIGTEIDPIVPDDSLSNIKPGGDNPPRQNKRR